MIRQLLRKALLEGKHTHKNEYGCVMISLEEQGNRWGEMLSIIEDEDLYNPKEDPSFGKELKPHVTVLFGLHEAIPLEEIEVEIDKIKEPSFTFNGVSSFTSKEYDVLKFDVTSKDFNKLNTKFKEFPHTSTFKDYHPHCTIAYLKPNMSDKYIKKLKEFVDIDMKPSHIIYSMVDKKEKTYSIG